MKRIGTAIVVAMVVMVGARPAAAFSLLDALTLIDEVPEVRAAALVVERARADVAAVLYPGDPSLSVAPTVRSGGSSGEPAPDFTTLAVTLGATWPLGLSRDARVRAERLVDAVSTAESQLAAARNDAATRVARQYFAARLTVREEAVLQAELAAARLRLETERARYERGEIAYTALGTAEDRLLEAEADLNRLGYDRDIAVPQLALTLGLDPRELNESMLSSLHAGDAAGRLGADLSARLPTKEELVAWATAAHPTVVARRIAVETLERELGVASTRLASASARLALDSIDHDVALSYNITAPSVSLSYTPPSYTFGTEPRSSSNSADWTVTMGVTVGIAGRTADTLSRDSATLDLQRARDLLAGAVQQIELEISAAYNALDRAREAQRRAALTVERARENQRIVEQRLERGFAGPADVAEAEARTRRAVFNETRAWIALQEAALNAASAASYAAELSVRRGGQ